MTKIQVGYQSTTLKAAHMGDGRGPDGFVWENGAVTEVWARDYAPRKPGDGCCVRSRDDDGTRRVRLCAKHGREPGIKDFCLQPPRNTRDPGLTP